MFDIKNYKTFFIEQIHKMHKYLLASSIETILVACTKSLLREERKFLIVLNVH